MNPPILAVSTAAQELFVPWLTNSIVVSAIVLVVVLLFARKAVSNMQIIPSGAQNAFEFLVEFLYNQVEGIVGAKVAPRAFPLLATIFIFVLVSNWFGLFPGVGTIGWPSEGHELVGPLTLDPHDHGITSLLRPATADLNFTLGIACCFMLLWGFLTIKELGVMGFISHTFAPKGGLKGFIWWALLPIFVFVGLIEIISIVFRPVSLSLRLFGNVYAGETLLHTMMSLGEKLGPLGSFITSIIFPLPFYFLEILVGILQATVFALLCAVYIQLSTSHDEEHH